MSVYPAVSGQGFGAALIEAADEQACNRPGLSALMLITFRVTRWNAPWFRRIGSQPVPPDNRE
jgi:GNAT superfamily N-acetyltransferase